MGRHGVLALESPLESERFGLRIFRAQVEAFDASAIADVMKQEHIDVLIVRLPARAIGTVYSARPEGFAPIVADTLVRYDIDVRSWTPDATTSVALRPAGPADAKLLARIAHEIFEGYVSHYHANPLFAADRIIEGYAEWASRHASAMDGSGAWIVERDGKAVGFSCYCIDRANATGIAVLNGILPSARRQGAYRGMLGRMLAAFKEEGLSRFEISTQVHNIPVQRVWTAYGLALRQASITVHVNALDTHMDRRRA